MSQIHFIGGEKGGVGKSVVARLMAQYCIDHALLFRGFDTDESHGALERFYTDYSAPVRVESYASLDQLVEAAAAQECRVLVDLAAQTHSYLARWLSDSALLESAGELGLSLCYWHVMDSGRDSVALLGRLLDTYGGKIPIVRVLNELRGESFDILDDSPENARAQALGLRRVRIRHLADATMQKIDRYSASFWAAVNATDRDLGALGLLERQRVKVWLARAFEEIGPVLRG